MAKGFGRAVKGKSCPDLSVPTYPLPVSQHPPIVAPDAPILEVKGVIKRYGERVVLDRVDFSIAPGERVALMGPSGSGKSTLLNCVGGIDRPDAGEVHVAGKRIDRLDHDALASLRRRTVTTIFQFFHLLPTLTASENVALPLQLLGIKSAECDRRVAELLGSVGVDHRADALPEQLSGGEMQRVAIARALAPEPSVILADEPTGNLDSTTGESILDLLESLSDRLGCALLLVTHSRRAARICHRTLLLRDGKFEGHA